MSHRRVLSALCGTGLALAAVAPSALATSLPVRTVVVSQAPDGTPADGASSEPVLSSSGEVLAFDSTATNLGPRDPNGPTRDVYTVDLATNARRLVSEDLTATGANGPSYQPAISGNGRRVVFTSDASNLVAGDTNGVQDVFVRDADGEVFRLSVAADGTQADGPSYSPDVSEDGRYVVFVSEADNLVPGDTNGQADVFLRDLRDNTIARVSVGADDAQANARSWSPAISADGRSVAFTSGASNLVKRDTNGLMDVFVRDLRRNRTERVSVATSGRQQNRSVKPPFVQIPSISGDGRYVAFDSDATTLYKPDTNKHTDVFLRDRKKDTTTLVSASSINQQGNNDSFAPRLTKNGRFVSFESFATNLVLRDGPREDIFLRDLRQGTTSIVNVTSSGFQRTPEQVPQLLQRPALSQDGSFAAFSSTSTNLVPGDTNGAEDVFVRLLDAPSGRVVNHPKPDHAGLIRVVTDDPLAQSNVCQIDKNRPFVCPLAFKIQRYVGHRLAIRVGGTGMRYSSERLFVKLSNDDTGPRVTIDRPRGGSVSVIRGRATDRSGIAKVAVSIFINKPPNRCVFVTRRNSFSPHCDKLEVLLAKGKRRWSVKLPHRVRSGSIHVFARATDRIGNTGKSVGLRQIIG